VRLKIQNILILIGIGLLLSCEPSVQSINYGQDGCSYCRMTIVEDHYGSEIVTQKGKVYKFDSIECLSAFVLKKQIAEEDIHELYFTDLEDAGHLYPKSELIFVQAKKLNSPMGLNLSAYRNPQTAANVAELYFGDTLNWKQVQDFVEISWLK